MVNFKNHAKKGKNAEKGRNAKKGRNAYKNYAKKSCKKRQKCRKIFQIRKLEMQKQVENNISKNACKKRQRGVYFLKDLFMKSSVNVSHVMATTNVAVNSSLIAQPTGNEFQLLRGLNDPEVPWLAFLIGQTPSSI